jgi:predicted MPP superfamily phosphohydrolase
MQTMTIVHFSDLHLQRESQFTQKGILSKLVEDAQKVIREKGLSAPFVAISGDLACSGTQKEYEYVEKFSHKLIDELAPLGLIFCPGNHDLNWEEYDKTCNSSLMNSLIKEPNPENIKNIERRFHTLEKDLLKRGMDNYYQFLKRMGQSYNDDFLYSLKNIDIGKTSLSFVSMNSAYLFSRDYKDFGYIGQTQMKEAFEETQTSLPKNMQAFNIALFHHPFESIAPASEVDTERFLKSRYGLFLNGHVHNLKVYCDLTENLTGESARRPLISCARCAIDKEEDPYVTAGYSIFRIGFDDGKVGSIAIYERKYRKEDGEWGAEDQVEYPIVVRSSLSSSPNSKMLNTELDMYKEGIKIATDQTHKQLVIYQRTPSLLLGAKPYANIEEKSPCEEEYMRCLEGRIKSCVKNQDLSITYLFSLEKTKKIIKKYKNVSVYALEALKRLKKQEKDSNGHFRFEYVPFKFLGPLMIGDLGYMVWIGSKDIGGEILVLSSNQDAETSNLAKSLTDRLALKQTTAEQMKKQLGLN